MCTNFQTKLTIWIFRPKIAKNWILGSEFQKSKSGFGINILNIPWVSIFSQNGQFLIFRPGGAGWSLVEVEISWVEMDGAGWRWVHGLVIPKLIQHHNFRIHCEKKKLCGATYWLLEIKIRHCPQTTSIDTMIWLFRIITNNSTNPIFYYGNVTILLTTLEATFLRCSEEKMSWKYSANLQENTHAEVLFQ